MRVPSGTVTFVLTDVESSTEAWQSHRSDDLAHHALTLSADAGLLPDVAENLVAVAGIAAAAESWEEAARLFAAADALRRQLGSVIWRWDQEVHDADLDMVRRSLDAVAFEAAWAEGEALGLEDAVAYASRGRGERKRPSAGLASLPWSDRSSTSSPKGCATPTSPNASSSPLPPSRPTSATSSTNSVSPPELNWQLWPPAEGSAPRRGEDQLRPRRPIADLHGGEAVRKLLAVGVIATGTALGAAPGAFGGVRGTFSYREHGRAVARESTTLEAKAGTSIVVQTHVLEPGFRAPWHRHPGESWVLMKRGALTVYFSCTEKVVWEAGNAYHNPRSEMAVNEGEEPVELLVIYVNVPADHPAGVIPASPDTPPAECPL